MKKRRFYGLLLFLILAGMGSWIIGKMRSVGQEAKRHSVLVIVDDSNNDRWIAMKQGMEQAAGDCQIDLNVISTGPFFDLEEELSVLQRELSNPVDGVILQMISSDGVYEVLKELLEKETVMFVETDIQPEECFTSIVPDNIGIGAALADCILKDYGEELEGNRIGILGGNQEQISMQQRLLGFTEQMEGSKVEVSWVLTSGEEASIAKKEAVSPVDILVTLENAQTEQAVDYLQEVRTIATPCTLYGEGISEKAVYYLDRGVIQSLVVPNEFQMGYLCIQEISRQLSHPSIEGESSQVDFLVVDKENLYDAENQKILFPIVQ